MLIHSQRKKKKTQVIQPGDAFENTAFELVFENVKGRREAALNLFVKQMPPIDSRHRADSSRCNFHLRIAGLTLVSLLERYLVLETAMPRSDIRKRPSAHL
jgi:hypothetical protein